MSGWCGTAGALPELAGVALIARAAQFSGAEAWGLRCVAKANLDFHFILYALALVWGGEFVCSADAFRTEGTV